MKRLYYGPHLCRALMCLRAGYEANAISWMERDIGEECGDPAEYPMPGTLQETPLGCIVNGEACGIEYMTVADATAGACGEGI